ncbi:MAG: iron-containing alcohol dehydrogenase [Lachnospiraceae bacterium]|nr:iron-containing alcohol dehydrogenase [Lachnospiraceae bacterium]
MNNFTYYTPTKVVFGKDSETQVGILLQEFSATKILLHYGGESAKRSGLLSRIETILTETGIAYVTLGGVKPNPRLSLIYEGIDLCKKESVDFILAVGGGSVIDSAKAIGYGVANEGDVWDFYSRKRTASACLPIGAILTIAAAGSEMSNSSVITNEDGWLKRGYKSDFARCKFAIMNPELTYTLPEYQTASGCVDIMMHTMERYFNQSENMLLTDGISEHLMRTVMKSAKRLKKDPENYAARAEVMWASSLSHNGLTGCGTDGGDWAAHQLEHELGGMFDVAHGAGLAAIWGSWARYVYKEHPVRFAQFAVKVHKIAASSKDLHAIPKDELDILALAGIKAMEHFYHAIGMPTSLQELGIDVTDEQIEELAEKCSFNQTRTIGVIKKLDKADMIAIFTAAR